jgi:glutamate 5-kinase
MQKRKRVVVKVGTKVLTSKDRALDRERVRDVVRQISDIKDGGFDVALVTSGAIGSGLWLLGSARRPTELSRLQAAAAIGQNHLMGLYADYFKERGFLTGQVLLTQDDFDDRQRYLNIKHTILALFSHNAVPVINENDTVATDEIRCGDNDRLSSLVADLCRAEKLILLTDVDGLLDERGSVIPFVTEVTGRIAKLGGRSHCDLGTGGMATKIEAASAASKAGIDCVIANGSAKDVLRRIVLGGEPVGTLFAGGGAAFAAKKRWIAFSSRAKGSVRVDDGARSALAERNRSLLASGIVRVEGPFAAGDTVRICGASGEEFARGVSNYSSSDILKIKGLKTAGYRAALGYKGADEVVHKDNLVIL